MKFLVPEQVSIAKSFDSTGSTLFCLLVLLHTKHSKFVLIFYHRMKRPTMKKIARPRALITAMTLVWSTESPNFEGEACEGLEFLGVLWFRLYQNRKFKYLGRQLQNDVWNVMGITFEKRSPISKSSLFSTLELKFFKVVNIAHDPGFLCGMLGVSSNESWRIWNIGKPVVDLKVGCCVGREYHSRFFNRFHIKIG